MKQKRVNMKYLPVIICIIILLILIALPTGYEDAVIYKGADRSRAKVITVNDTGVISSGLIKSGIQSCTIELIDGKFKGQQVTGTNLLSGSLEQDKVYVEGDIALVMVSYKENEVLSVSMIDHFRIDKEILLFVIYGVILIAFAKGIGIRSLLSFAIAILAIWKVLVPYCLNGYDPILIGFMLVVILTLVIISLVYGYDRRFVAASAGVLLGVVTTCFLGIIFTDLFQIHGAIMSYSESLLYSGYENLNLTKIFMSSIFIGASGALMDIAVDITSAVHEVVLAKPNISKKDAITAGINVGRAAMGTMTTTLLLAYSGGYIALLMVFMAQGTPIINILNYKYVSAEILHTIVGSFGLVAVAPFTAIMSGILLANEK